jgi:hypothetical protein
VCPMGETVLVAVSTNTEPIPLVGAGFTVNLTNDPVLLEPAREEHEQREAELAAERAQRDRMAEALRAGKLGSVIVTIPLFATDAPHTKTAISLPDLVRQTNAFSKKYRGGCTPRLLNSNPKELFLHYNVKCNKEDSDPSGHDVRVKFDLSKLKETKQAKDLDIQVSCSCPAFLYWGAQWNLHQRDGLLGDARPELKAPTERLDLRGNYVICKHIHAVFERVLPSVQHNINNILREREVKKRKDVMEEVPEKLHKEQEQMKKRKELEKVKKIKDKNERDRLLDEMQREEEERIQHEKELDEMSEAVPVEEEEAPAGIPAWMKLPERYQKAPTVKPREEEEAIEGLTREEEAAIEEAHKEHTPHLHKGLPYRPHKHPHIEEIEFEEEE